MIVAARTGRVPSPFERFPARDVEIRREHVRGTAELEPRARPSLRIARPVLRQLERRQTVVEVLPYDSCIVGIRRLRHFAFGRAPERVARAVDVTLAEAFVCYLM